MAKVILPLMSEAARGKFGGSIFNQWRSIQYAKRWASPTNPGTPAQLARRAALTTFTRSWATLTNAQRAAWSNWAENHLRTDWTGKPLRITGQNAYISCNSRLAILEVSAISDPPAVPGPLAIDTLTIAQPGATTTAITAEWTQPISGNESIVFWGEGPISFGREPSRVRAKIISVQSSGVVTPIDLIAPTVKARYGVWAEVWDPATGLAGPPTFVRFDAK